MHEFAIADQRRQRYVSWPWWTTWSRPSSMAACRRSPASSTFRP